MQYGYLGQLPMLFHLQFPFGSHISHLEEIKIDGNRDSHTGDSYVEKNDKMEAQGGMMTTVLQILGSVSSQSCPVTNWTVVNKIK
mmetsp:Transcript_14490/g.21293  ORF Transcript_14490/g.21293 Transcript_14490/m.21293 type:complete len:85 (+) Transcript_14490:390-644(+)